jgi:AcrR family transcriptional regulator
LTRDASTAITRHRILDAAHRLFRERGYAATSMEQIADAAGVTKGAIYGHFASKEDLLISSVETASLPDYGAVLYDASMPIQARFAAFATALVDDATTADRPEFAVGLEFFAALLRNPDASERYAIQLERVLDLLAESDPDEPSDVTKKEAWAIGHALYLGLQIYRSLAPELMTSNAFVRAYELLGGLYPELWR